MYYNQIQIKKINPFNWITELTVFLVTIHHPYYKHEILPPSALVQTVTSGFEVKLEIRGSKPFASMTSCWLWGLVWTMVVTTSTAFAQIFEWEFFR